MGTISDLNELTIPDPLDLMLVREASDLVDRDKKMKLGQLAFKAQTPVALANRVAAWKDANTLFDAGFAYTDVARLSQGQTYLGANLFSGANVFTPQQTFNGGVMFGGAAPQNNLNYNRDVTAFTPQFADAVTLGNVANMNSANGYYTRIGNRCFVDIWFDFGTFSNLVLANIAYIRNFPFPAVNIANYRATGTISSSRMVFNSEQIAPVIIGNTSYVTVSSFYAAAASPATTLTVAAFDGGGFTDVLLSINYACQ